jgi:hypothetical protein
MSARRASRVGLALAGLAAVSLALSSPRLRSYGSAPLDDREPDLATPLGQEPETDSVLAVRFLAGLRGATPLTCEMAIRTLGIGWGWQGEQRVPDARLDQQELIRWASDGPGDASAIPPLRAGLVDDDPCVRRMAARLLGRMRNPQANEALLSALSAPDPALRSLAAIGLGYAEDRTTVDPLMATLRDEVPSVRATAAWALGEIEDERALPALARLLARDSAPEVRRAAAIAIGNLY